MGSLTQACLVVGLLAAATPPHDPTDQAAWQGLGPAGAFAHVRALAVEGTDVWVLSDQGVSRVDASGRVEAVLPPEAAAQTQALWVTPQTIWLGGPDGVRRVDRASKQVSPWSPQGPPAAMDRVLFDGQGGVYLYEKTSGALTACEADGRWRWRLARLYDLPDTLSTPEAVARRPNGDVYIADAENNRIVIVTADGQHKGRVPDNFCRPHGLAVLPEDRLAVLCDYTEQIDTPLVTLLGPDDLPEADWVSDQRVVLPHQPSVYKYSLGYWQKVGDHPKRWPGSLSPLSCVAAMPERLVVGQAVTGSVKAVALTAFGPSAKYPARRRRTFTQAIGQSRADYTLAVAGTLDWRNTTRSTTHSGYTLTPLFMCDDSYTIRNVGQTPVVNPHFSINGQGDFFSAEHIRRAIVRPGMTNLEKAFAVYNFVRSYLNGTNWPAGGTGMCSQYYVFSWWGLKQQTISLVNKWNNFGAPGACGCYSAYVAKLAHDLGLPGRNGGVVGHCPSFVKVDGQEVYLDAIMAHSYRQPITGIFCPRIDDQGLADYDAITHDQYLILRTAEFPCRLAVAGCFGRKESHHLESYDKPPIWVTIDDTSKLALRLRPGEAITKRTAWFGRSAVEPAMLMDAIVNGDITYRPNFADGTYRFGVVEEKGVEVRDGVLRPVDGQASIAFSMACPHPLLNGLVTLRYQRASAEDELEMDLDIGSSGWQRLWRASRVGQATELIPLWPLDRWRDDEAREWRVPAFAYAVRFRLRPARPGRSMAIGDLTIASLFQTFYQCQPRLVAGQNRIAYEDETPGEHRVEITHRWKESAFGQEPRPPAEPIFPKDGATVTGYEFAFKWAPAVDPAGAAIADYEWECSPRPDFLWHVGPNFSTYTRGKTEEPVPEYSLLTHDKPYYWRVRACNDRGVWGPWSRTWTFRCHGPRVPVDVAIRQDGRRFILSWKPNPQGTRPVRYEVFGDVEPGFFPVVTTWHTYEQDRRKPFDKPSNIILTTDQTEAVVVADGLQHGDRTFFRVAAIDAAGSRSGPSPYVAARHPFIFTEPVTRARKGQPYRYQARSLWSLGEFALGDPGISRPHKDVIRFELQQAPAWLKLDPETGQLTGTPDQAGAVDVVLAVADGRGGSDTQPFRIEVAP